MQGIFRASIAYALSALALTGWLYGDAARLIWEAGATVHASAGMMIGAAGRIWPWLLIGFALLGRRRIAARMAPLVFVTGATLLLTFGFSFAKNAIPVLVPYYADPALAAFDNWLHFGRDPWRIAHDLLGDRGPGGMPWLYLMVWGLCAIGFPVVVAATDPDFARARRYLWLFFASWLVIGNVLALAGSSVGPVYYDRLTGTERFGELTLALAASGLSETGIGVIQEWLWQRYLGGGLDLGLGISAFPSMHVAVAAIVALYLAERSRWLAPLGGLFLLSIFFVSVYTGYHYAIDGYVACLVVLAGHFGLRHLSGVKKRKNVAHSRCVTIASFRQVS